MLIKDFNYLMYNKTKHKERKYFFMRCFQHFSSPDILSRHKSSCMVINGEQAIRMPEKENNTLKFQNFHKQMPVPFVIYADFEAIFKHFQEANECHICNQAYTNKDIRVRDHCHITGSYRGSAHQYCNLKVRINSKEFKIPVIFHNLKGYDSYFIMQEIGGIVKQQQMDINAINNNNNNNNHNNGLISVHPWYGSSPDIKVK